MQRFTAPLFPTNPKADDWDFFQRQFGNYIAIVEAKEEQKLPLFLNCLGRDGLMLYDRLPAPKTLYEDAIAWFTEHFSGRTSVLLKRKQFYEAHQGHQESISNFAVRLRRLTHECEFANDATTLMRDIFVVGIYDDRLGERLLAEDASKLTFDMALAKAEAFERARQEQGVVARSSEVNSITHSRGRVTKDDSRDRRATDAGRGGLKQSQATCYRCGSFAHKANEASCPARNKTCRRCSKVGHYEACCRMTSRTSGGKHNVNCVQQATDCDLFACYSVSNVNEPENSFVNLDDLSREILINGTCKVFALIDSGASLNILPHGLVPDLHLEPSDAKVFAWGGFPIEVLGVAEVDVAYKEKRVKAKFHVVAVERVGSKVRSLMTFDLCRKLGLLLELAELCSIHESLARPATPPERIAKEFSDLFTGTGLLSTGVEYSISIDKQASPFSQPARRVPPAIMPKVKTALEHMVDEGVIRPIDEPTPFCSPMVVAYRKNGDVRIVTDLRKLNQCVQREEFQIPTIDELAFKARGAKVFSQCDLKSGFWQIPVAKQSQKFLAFSTPFSRFCYQKLPMGLSASPEVFSRILHKVLEGLDKVLIYVDDIVIATETIEEHTTALRNVLQRLRQAGLKLNEGKCSFFASEIKFMGHIWDAEGVRSCPEKIRALQQMPPPVDRQSLRSFLGLAGYVGQRHVPHYGSLVKPLWEMLQKNMHFEWTENRLRTYE